MGNLRYTVTFYPNTCLVHVNLAPLVVTLVHKDGQDSGDKLNFGDSLDLIPDLAEALEPLRVQVSEKRAGELGGRVWTCGGTGPLRWCACRGTSVTVDRKSLPARKWSRSLHAADHRPVLPEDVRQQILTRGHFIEGGTPLRYICVTIVRRELMPRMDSCVAHRLFGSPPCLVACQARDLFINLEVGGRCMGADGDLKSPV